MTVKELIKELKKMPQNLDVGYAHGDNSAEEARVAALKAIEKAVGK